MLKFIPFLFLAACSTSTVSNTLWSPPMVTHCGQIEGGVLTDEQKDCFKLSAVAIAVPDHLMERPSLGHYLADRFARWAAE